MGAYLSEPVTEKVSSDDADDKLEYGASSMQGWRVNQEDAHNTIIGYDLNTSLFAVYDGHGGAEVATYCADNLPDFIKNTEAYIKGDYIKALEEAFLEFDAKIATKEVMDILKKLAGEINPPGASDNEAESDDENVKYLYQDAKLPLQEVLAKYGKMNPLHRTQVAEAGMPLSPCLRAKRNTEEAGGSAVETGCSAVKAGCSAVEAGCSAVEAGSSAVEAGSSAVEAGCSAVEAGDSISEAGSSGAGASSSSTAPSGSVAHSEASSSKNGLPKAQNDDDAGGVSSTNNDDKDVNGVVSTSDSKLSPMEVDKCTAPDSSEDNRDLPEQSGDSKVTVTGNGSGDICNGEVSESKQDAEDSNITSSNGSTTPVKGKAKDKSSPVSSSEKAAPERPNKSKQRRAAAAVYETLLRHAADADADSDSDSNDETFQGGDIHSDDDDVNGVEESSNDDDAEEEEDEEEEGEGGSSDEDGEEDISMSEEPGLDSGCTAVVALLRGNELYVANAGDSRCIICRDGKAVDMSVDHKPEDEPELDRITKAGGKVSNDGRINGGLNLSRALGDHSYKQNKDLGPKEQMITAQPDVKTLTIDPAKDQFMVLACDGIWNYMSSQDVCDFIVPKLAEGRERLSQICEEMFDHCLAPTTMGDGTGCDNMTAIIVRFKDGLIAEVAQHGDGPKKRAAEDEPTQEQQDSKRQKVDDPLSSSVVTSSV